MSSNHYELNDPPQDAISAVKFAPGQSTRLLVSSWDKHVYLYETRAGPGGSSLKKFEHRAPVLDVAFGDSEDDMFTAGLDWDVRRINAMSDEQEVLSTHDAPVCALAYDSVHHTLYSASWDSTLHIHHVKDPLKTPATIPLPAKPFALTISPTKLVVSMAGRLVHIYDLSAVALLASQAAQPPPNTVETEPLQRRESSLKFMTRAVAARPDDSGFVCSSIEGRVAVEWFDASAEAQAKKYAFKCHRAAGVADGGGDVVYPVHALAFHPEHQTFVTGGGDGVVALWDAVNKRRIKQYQKYATSVASTSFSGDGKLLAVGVSPGFEDAREDVGEGSVRVWIRELGSDAKGKSSKG